MPALLNFNVGIRRYLFYIENLFSKLYNIGNDYIELHIFKSFFKIFYALFDN